MNALAQPVAEAMPDPSLEAECDALIKLIGTGS